MEIKVKTTHNHQMIDITHDVENAVHESGITDGIVIIFNPHTTGAVTINEGADPAVISDILKSLSELIPGHAAYNHLEGNSDAHIKSALMGSDRVVIIRKGKLLLGTWQKIFFCEFDGPRDRKIQLKIIAG
ncbi:MAG: YjbQ family protein [Acidobacteria bacterium]|nr:YjbQ family protein [Acidobacteriota bacterium]